MSTYIDRLLNAVSSALELNSATLSGAVDIVVVEDEDGTLRSTPFHVRFGKLQLLRSREKIIEIGVEPIEKQVEAEIRAVAAAEEEAEAEARVATADAGVARRDADEMAMDAAGEAQPEARPDDGAPAKPATPPAVSEGADDGDTGDEDGNGRHNDDGTRSSMRAQFGGDPAGAAGGKQVVTTHKTPLTMRLGPAGQAYFLEQAADDDEGAARDGDGAGRVGGSGGGAAGADDRSGTDSGDDQRGRAANNWVRALQSSGAPISARSTRSVSPPSTASPLSSSSPVAAPGGAPERERTRARRPPATTAAIGAVSRLRVLSSSSKVVSPTDTSRKSGEWVERAPSEPPGSPGAVVSDSDASGDESSEGAFEASWNSAAGNDGDDQRTGYTMVGGGSGDSDSRYARDAEPVNTYDEEALRQGEGVTEPENWAAEQQQRRHRQRTHPRRSSFDADALPAQRVGALKSMAVPTALSSSLSGATAGNGHANTESGAASPASSAGSSWGSVWGILRRRTSRDAGDARSSLSSLSASSSSSSSSSSSARQDAQPSASAQREAARDHRRPDSDRNGNIDSTCGRVLSTRPPQSTEKSEPIIFDLEDGRQPAAAQDSILSAAQQQQQTRQQQQQIRQQHHERPGDGLAYDSIRRRSASVPVRGRTFPTDETLASHKSASRLATTESPTRSPQHLWLHNDALPTATNGYAPSDGSDNRQRTEIEPRAAMRREKHRTGECSDDASKYVAATRGERDTDIGTASRTSSGGATGIIGARVRDDARRLDTRPERDGTDESSGADLVETTASSHVREERDHVECGGTRWQTQSRSQSAPAPLNSSASWPSSVEDVSAELVSRHEARNSADGDQPLVTLSLCQHLIDECASDAHAAEVFDAHRVSLQRFRADPTLLHHPHLMAKVDGLLYPRRVAAPLLAGTLTYGVQLDAATVDHFTAASTSSAFSTLSTPQLSSTTASSSSSSAVPETEIARVRDTSDLSGTIGSGAIAADNAPPDALEQQREATAVSGSPAETGLPSSPAPAPSSPPSSPSSSSDFAAATAEASSTDALLTPQRSRPPRARFTWFGLRSSSTAKEREDEEASLGEPLTADLPSDRTWTHDGQSRGGRTSADGTSGTRLRWYEYDSAAAAGSDAENDGGERAPVSSSSSEHDNALSEDDGWQSDSALGTTLSARTAKRAEVRAGSPPPPPPSMSTATAMTHGASGMPPRLWRERPASTSRGRPGAPNGDHSSSGSGGSIGGVATGRALSLPPTPVKSSTAGAAAAAVVAAAADTAAAASDTITAGAPRSSTLHRSQYVRKSLCPSSRHLRQLGLRRGANKITFTVSSKLQGVQQVSSRIYLWPYDAKIVISDVDGTITRSDVLGQILPRVGKDWSQRGVAGLYRAIAQNGYKFVYLTSRAIGQANSTRSYLASLLQDGNLGLPDGPVMMSPDGVLESFTREVIRRRPQEFKIAALEQLRVLFPRRSFNPFYAGFGNRVSDSESYFAVGVPREHVFLVNSTGELQVGETVYDSIETFNALRELVDSVFPDIRDKRGHAAINEVTDGARYNEWNFWRRPYSPLSGIDDVDRLIAGTGAKGGGGGGGLADPQGADVFSPASTRYHKPKLEAAAAAEAASSPSGAADGADVGTDDDAFWSRPMSMASSTGSLSSSSSTSSPRQSAVAAPAPAPASSSIWATTGAGSIGSSDDERR